MSSAEVKRLLLISHHNSYRIAPYISAARRLGIEVTIASEGRHSLVTEVVNGVFVDFNDIQNASDTLLRQHSLTPFHGVLGSDDVTVELAASIARRLGLAHNPPEAARWSYRKDLARARLELAGCPVPWNRLLDLDRPIDAQTAELRWPCVLKPLNLSASRGVIRADDRDEFIAAAERIRPILAHAKGDFERQHLLVEEYIDGIEIAFEGFLRQGELCMITIFDKPDPLTGPYFEETIYVTPTLLDAGMQQTVHDTVQQACKAYGLVTGAVHAECRIDEAGQVWILEIASRTIGGDCGRILDSEDFNIEELAVSLAIDHAIEVNPPGHASGVMMIPIRDAGILRRVEGLSAANRVSNIERVDIIIPEGHELVPLPEGNRYLGYIFARADSAQEVTQSLREAHSHLSFVTRPVFRATIPGHVDEQIKDRVET